MQDLFHFQFKIYRSWEYQDFNSLNNDGKPIGIEPGVYSKHGEWKYLKTYEDEETFVKNYANLLYSVMNSNYTFVVCKDEDKISIKIFETYRERQKGRFYFKVKKNVWFLTFNIKNCALYKGYILNYHLKRKCAKKITRVGGYLQPINEMRLKINNALTAYSLESTKSLMLKTDIQNSIINTFLSAIPGIENYGDLNDDLKLAKYMFDSRGVKLPNNWNVLIQIYPQPIKKQYSKCDNKYIDSFMMVNGLSGDKIRRVLHNVSTCNISNLKGVMGIFGKDFILSQPDEFIKDVFESNQTLNSQWGDNFYKIITKKEKMNVFEIFKLTLKHKIYFNVFQDHIRLYKLLKSFEEVKWRASDMKSFNDEHYDFSERHSFYTKGEFTRVYNPEKVSKTEEIILSVDEPLYPVVLLTSGDYNMESKIQSNCVKGYVDKATSIIVSLRRGDKHSQERATIEYFFKLIFDKVYISRVQSLGRFNQGLPKEWESALKILDERMEKIWAGENFEYPKVIVKLAHKTIETDSEFSTVNNYHFLNRYEGLSLSWKEKIINDVRSIPIEDNYLFLEDF